MRTFAYRPKQDVPSCPRCGVTVPTGADTAQAFRLNVRKNGESFTCVVRTCWCGLDLAVDQTRETLWGYSFRCKRCGQYQAELPFDARCTACFMSQTMGLRDPQALVAAIREAEVFIPATRQDTIDGLIAGLLAGAPGLTVDDSAA